VASGAPRRIFCTITPVDRVPGEALGRGEPDELDTLFLGIRDLPLRPRHVGPIAAIEAFDTCRPLPDGGTHAVHRRIAAADDHHALAVGVQLTRGELGHLVAEAHAVRRRQVVDRAHDALRTDTGRRQVAGLVDAGRDDDEIMLGADILEGNVRAHVAVHHEFDAAILKLGVAAHHHVLLKLEARNAIDHQAARPVVAVINRHLQTRAAQHVGGGKAAGTRAYDAD
jgi:hypothetical protein